MIYILLQNMKEQHSLFKFIWDLHSGSLWGITGRIVIDIIGLLFLFISFSGFMIWLYKKQSKEINQIIEA